MTQGTEPPAPSAQPVIPVCYRHPQTETYVRCARCDRPICPNCMITASVGFQCPECVAEGRRASRAPRTAFGGSLRGAQGTVTKVLIGINILVMLASLASAGSALGGRALLGGFTPLLEWGAVRGWGGQYLNTATGALYIGPFGIARGEYYRLFTQMFLHYGLVHLLINMWALWVLGRIMEATLGRVRFLALYLVAGLGGGTAAYLFTPDSFTAGASGAIFGLFAALFVVMKRLGRDTSAVVPLLVINVAISFLPGISLAGHMGGLVVGGTVAAALAYAPRKNRTLVVTATIVAWLFVMAGAVAFQTAALQNAALVPY